MNDAMSATKIFRDVDTQDGAASGVDTPHHYELMLNGDRAGFIEYHLYGKVAIVTHTEVDRRYEGQGVGSELARQMLQFFRSQDWQVVPVCGFFAHYLRTHSENATLVTPACRRLFDI
jgi:uncharacterized protein